VMPPKKRSAESEPSKAGATETRASKVAKTRKDAASTKAAKAASASPLREKKAAKRPPKNTMLAEDFQKSALPLHVHFTHTPPSVSSPEKGSSEPNKSIDPGHLASVTMLPSTFSTGSHGWKASKPVAIELTDPSTGKKTKVNVQISINAVVKGSKEAVTEAKNAEEENAVDATVNAEDDDEE